MPRWTMIAVTATLLSLSGCNDDTQETAEPQKEAVAAQQVAEPTPEPAPQVEPEPKPTVQQYALPGTMPVKNVEVKPREVAADGAALYKKCAACHGADGKKPALNKSAVIAGQSASELTASLTAYRNGSRNVSGMGALMKGQVGSMSDAQIAALAEYISGL